MGLPVTAGTMPTGHPAHSLPKGLHSLVFSLHFPAPCLPWGAFHARAGLPIASAIVDSCVNTHPGVKGHCLPPQHRGTEQKPRGTKQKPLSLGATETWPLEAAAL